MRGQFMKDQIKPQIIIFKEHSNKRRIKQQMKKLAPLHCVFL